MVERMHGDSKTHRDGESFCGRGLQRADAEAGMMVVARNCLLIQKLRKAAKLKATISVTATVIRDGKPQEARVSQLVPGDVVVLAAGDMILADVCLLAAKDLFVTQSSLTGESFPVEKFAIEKNPSATLPIELTSIAFLGTSVESGSATGIVIATGKETYLGGVSASLSEQEPPTSFDRGISQFTWLLVRFVLVMVPLVFLINGFTKNNWGMPSSSRSR